MEVEESADWESNAWPQAFWPLAWFGVPQEMPKADLVPVLPFWPNCALTRRTIQSLKEEKEPSWQSIAKLAALLMTATKNVHMSTLP